MLTCIHCKEPTVKPFWPHPCMLRTKVIFLWSVHLKRKADFHSLSTVQWTWGKAFLSGAFPIFSFWQVCARVCVHKSAPSLYGHTVLTMSRSKAEQGHNFNQPLSEPGWSVEVSACVCVRLCWYPGGHRYIKKCVRGDISIKTTPDKVSCVATRWLRDVGARAF